MHDVKLYVMRHGPAEDVAASGRDDDRALTASGRERVHRVAQLLAEHAEVPRRIVTSPLVRAVQTAEIVHAELRLDGAIDARRELVNGGRGASLVDELVAADMKRTMIVGHEPDLSDLIVELTGTPVIMQKSMVVGISFTEGARARIAFVLDPKALTVARGAHAGG